MGRELENPFSQKHCKCRRGSALGAHVLPAFSHPPSVRNVLGTSTNKSSQSRELSPRPWVSSAIRHRVFLTESLTLVLFYPRQPCRGRGNKKAGAGFKPAPDCLRKNGCRLLRFFETSTKNYSVIPVSPTCASNAARCLRSA